MIGIYKITNLITQQSYIGQSNNIERREIEHFNNNKYNQQKIDKEIQNLGKENFSFEILEECSIDKLNEREKYWINFYDSFYHGYNQTKGGQNEYCGHPILNIDDIKEIRTAYNNHEKRQEVYLKYKDKITYDGFCHIWDGSRWKNVMPEVYNEENKTFHRDRTRFSSGEEHPLAKLTDNEVIKIRQRYVNETASQIWQDYKDKYTLGSFKQILIGVKYSHLPIYKKQEKRWTNE